MLVGHLGFFILNIKTSLARKLHRGILLHFGLATLTFDVKKNSGIMFHLGILGSWGRRGGAKMSDGPSNKFFKILNTGSISSREHEMESW